MIVAMEFVSSRTDADVEASCREAEDTERVPHDPPRPERYEQPGPVCEVGKAPKTT